VTYVVGAPFLLALFYYYLGIASTIPFFAGLLGFSRRIVYFFVLVLMCGTAGLEAITFFDRHKHQHIDIGLYLVMHLVALCYLALVLLFAFVLAHWLGAILRAGFLSIWNHWFEHSPRI
jgi:hypothetical protein